MQTQKQISRPADPSRLSFLDRPGEIRNMIYEVLFKRDEPVLLHDPDTYHAIEPSRESDESDYEFQERLAVFDSTYESEIGADHEFIHDFHLGLPMLLACRQIYHEAAGILYGNNTFTFSRVLSRHDTGYYGSHVNDYHQLTYAPKWLSSIGSQFGKLSKVLIDFDAICSPRCEHQQLVVDVLPLLRLLWKHDSKASPIAFAHTGRILHADCEHDSEDEEAPQANEKVQNLNAVISSVIGKGEFSLKKYAFSDRLITYATLDLEDLSLEVGFGGSYNHLNEGWKRFHIADSGKVTMETPDRVEKRLFDLPSHILSKIISMVVRSPSGITLDMNHHTAIGLDLSVLQLNRWSRKRYKSIIGRENDLTIINKSIDVTMSSTSATDVERLLTRSELCRLILPREDATTALIIALKFELAAPATPESLRIDIKNLLSLMSRRWLRSRTTISITLEQYEEGRCVRSEDNKVSLEDLSRQTFLLLSDAISNGNISPARLTRIELSGIFMNGYGKLLIASYRPMSMVSSIYIENRHPTLRAPQVKIRGYRFAEKLSKTIPGHHQHLYPEYLYGLWTILRNRYWADWESHRV